MASVVGTYARAFADVVVRGKLDPARMVQELRDFESLFGESELVRRVLENPSIPRERKHAVLDVIAKRAGMSSQARNFIAVVTERRRLRFMHDIVRQIVRELSDRLGFVDAEVISFRELSDSEKRLLESEIAKMTGKRVRASYQHDASILGGAVVKIGSTIYDGSVQGQLEKIREQLVESGS